MKKIIFYQSNFAQIGGVETMAYNWCWWLRNYFDVTVLYCTGDEQRLRKMASLVKLEKYQEGKTYECDIFIRNSVWGFIPKNIKAKRMIEIRHANYKYLYDKGWLFNQYQDMGIKEIVGCGEFVSKMSNEVLHDNPTTIKNILLPKKKTNKILKLISCTRLDGQKGWHRMQQMMNMMRNAGIKFQWDIFTNSFQKCDYEEVRFYTQRYDIWDYLANADYTVLLSDSEGLPYTVQESLQYQVPCIVSDVGGNTELITDGVNGYVVPLDMKFDINKIKNIPKCKEYNNHSLEDWLKYLDYKGKIIDEQLLIDKYEEERNMKCKIKANEKFEGIRDAERNVYPKAGDEWETSKERAEFLQSKGVVEIIEEIQPKKKVEEEKYAMVNGNGEILQKDLTKEDISKMKIEEDKNAKIIEIKAVKKTTKKNKKK